MKLDEVKMAQNLVTKLSNKLDEEIKFYELYLNHLHELQKDVVSGDTDAISHLLQNMNYSEEDFLQLKKERTFLIAQISDEESPYIQDIKPFIPKKVYDKLSKKRDKINAFIDEIKHVNSVNKLVIENALIYTRNRLGIFITPDQAAYSSSGKQNQPVSKSRMTWSV
jgi:flagellar biosynthesis/type III secretory pathway chaperone